MATRVLRPAGEWTVASAEGASPKDYSAFLALRCEVRRAALGSLDGRSTIK